MRREALRRRWEDLEGLGVAGGSPGRPCGRPAAREKGPTGATGRPGVARESRREDWRHRVTAPSVATGGNSSSGGGKGQRKLGTHAGCACVP